MSNEEQSNRSHGLGISIQGLFGVVMLLTVMATLVSFLARFHWALDLLAQFRVQYVMLSAVGLIVYLFLRKTKLAIVLLVCILVNLPPMLPYFFKPNRPVSEVGTPLRVVVFNVLTSNRRDAEVAQFLKEQDPDVLVIMESNQRWVDALDGIREAMPHFQLEPRADNFGLCLFSKLPLENFESIQLSSESVPSFFVRLPIGQQQVQFLATHPLPPMRRRYAEARNKQLKEAAKRFDVETPRIMVGDFNLTPWSPYFQDTCQQGELDSAAEGFGVEPTWYVFPTWLGGLKIDHVLISPDLEVVDYDVGPWLGSDHRPVVVDLLIPDTKP